MQVVVVAGLETHHTMYIGFHFGVDGRLGVWAFGRLGVWAVLQMRIYLFLATPTEVKSFFNFSDPLNHL
jgi:hypothetical protein